ncbi:OsmC family protein [Noviherbaspirillum aridicola]|uniref:Peroxiredoxin n=1 Tax=Noviherbaspirillum aridicola TaxID=2849687 RepID=A0ABQ4Q753_9BURK|nr:OsmC family protein [Noviherbaspirillum aridicola]GIZ53025.1 peroxiredoxin [Noviherbaspirillum aridicola]
MKRSASAVWQGDLKGGKGSISTASTVLKDTQYSFGTRFENGAGTNPEELIAAAHAGCFSMALSAALAGAGFTPERVATEATVSLEQVQGGWSITTVALRLDARVPGIDQAKFDQLAQDAKQNCPVSKVLNAEITLESTLQT